MWQNVCEKVCLNLLENLVARTQVSVSLAHPRAQHQLNSSLITKTQRGSRDGGGWCFHLALSSGEFAYSVLQPPPCPLGRFLSKVLGCGKNFLVHLK